MSRFLKLLSYAGMSSVYLMGTGACTTNDGGLSILPNVGSLTNLGGGLGLCLQVLAAELHLAPRER